MNLRWCVTQTFIHFASECHRIFGRRRAKAEFGRIGGDIELAINLHSNGIWKWNVVYSSLCVVINSSQLH